MAFAKNALCLALAVAACSCHSETLTEGADAALDAAEDSGRPDGNGVATSTWSHYRMPTVPSKSSWTSTSCPRPASDSGVLSPT